MSLFDINTNLPYGPQLILDSLWNHVQIRSWNQPVLRNESFLLKETVEAFDGVRVCDWQLTSLFDNSPPRPKLTL